MKRRYGVCYADGSIRIRLRHTLTGRSLKYSSLVNTLCHELAHLRHFNHGLRFRAFYFEMLDYARRERDLPAGPRAARSRRAWSEPSAARRADPPRPPAQLDLF